MWHTWSAVTLALYLSIHSCIANIIAGGYRDRKGVKGWQNWKESIKIRCVESRCLKLKNLEREEAMKAFERIKEKEMKKGKICRQTDRQ